MSCVALIAVFIGPGRARLAHRLLTMGKCISLILVWSLLVKAEKASETSS